MALAVVVSGLGGCVGAGSRQGAGGSIGVGDTCPLAHYIEHDTDAQAHGLGGVDRCPAAVGVVVFCLCRAALERLSGVYPGV
ncbi:hypothetical protein D3C86_1954620 [compost metagenome]